MPEYRYRLKDFAEVYELSHTLAQYFPQPEDAHTAIYELLFNALEHGNLGIGYQTKTELLREQRWADELHRRAELPDNRNKFVSAVIRSSERGCTLTISDQGDGFDWKTYICTETNKGRHGRGLCIVRGLGIPLSFNDRGNEITLKTSH